LKYYFEPFWVYTQMIQIRIKPESNKSYMICLKDLTGL
jgi:hypothetical protein